MHSRVGCVITHLLLGLSAHIFLLCEYEYVVRVYAPYAFPENKNQPFSQPL